MLIWVTALHCEAKPIIDHYRLKKSPSHHAFDIYLDDNTVCVISGIGRIAAAAATAWIAGINRDEPSIAWINIGTAGSATHKIGTALSINKISDDVSNQHFYPVPLHNCALESAHCQTLGQASTDYQAGQIYDMEASAFFNTATRFSSAELVHCVKIISDNPSQQTGRDKARISELINAHIAELADFVQSIGYLNDQVATLEIKQSDWMKFLACAHFTQTQKTRLNKSLRFLLSQQIQTDDLIAEAKDLRSADRIIAQLESYCHQRIQDL
jgi:nucleoside phosphorylase